MREQTPPPAAQVTAVVVHFRTPERTLRAARAVAESAPDAEVLVVDNDSRDSVGALLRDAVPDARLIVEPKNRGYGAACNRGARESVREYLLLVNSDAYVSPGAVQALATALEQDPRAAVAGPRLLDPDGSLQPSIQRLPSPWRVFSESSGLAKLTGGRAPFRGHSATREDHSAPRRVESLSGAVLLVRRSAFEEVGRFDESFFLYAEEADLIARLSRRGWRILFEPRAEAVHEGGASGGDRLFGQLHAGLVRYTRKHHGAGAAAFVRGTLAAGAAARYLAALATPGERGRTRRLRYRAARKGGR